MLMFWLFLGVCFIFVVKISKKYKESGDGTVNPSDIKIEVEIRDQDAMLPSRSRHTDAGYDIYSLRDTVISPGDIVDIDTGMAVVAPEGWFFTVEGRSSMYKSGVVPFRGIIDSGYTGNLIVSLMNVGTKQYHIKKHDRVAQIVPQKIIHIDFKVVDEISPEYNIRGTAGYGSSGK